MKKVFLLTVCFLTVFLVINKVNASSDNCMLIYPSDWTSCRTEADYTALNNNIAVQQAINRSLEFNADSYREALDTCRKSIDSYASIIKQYNSCVASSLSVAVERETMAQMDLYCIDNAGKQSFYNKATKTCECNIGFLKINNLCVNSEQVRYMQQQISDKAAKIEEAFQKYFKLAMDELPEYTKIVDRDVIKKLSLLPENANKTFKQIIIDTYQSKVVYTTVNISTTTPTSSSSIAKVIDSATNKNNYQIDNLLSNKLKGKIILQVEDKGQAYYVSPKDSKKYYMADGNKAYEVMRTLGVGITNKDLDKIKNNKTLAKKSSGKIFLQVESRGEAYYIDSKGVSHYLKDGQAAYTVMRNLGLGITNENLNKIEEGSF